MITQQDESRIVECAADPDLWFAADEKPRSIKGREQRRDDTLLAKAICSACPFARVCREYAEDNDIRYGTWGGLTAAERGWYEIDEPIPADQRVCRKCGCTFRFTNGEQYCSTLCTGAAGRIEPIEHALQLQLAS